MKKILIFSHALEIGGAERALLGLLEAIDTTEYQVDLFLMRHSGELMPYIPEKINLLPEIPAYSSMAIPVADVIRKKQIGVALGRLVGKRKAARRVKKLELPADNDVALEYSHKYTVRYMPKISDTEYELAISFLTPHYYVAEKVTAHKKAAFIHTDYSAVAVDTASQLPMWARYDRIFAVSDRAADSFVSIFPSLSDRVGIMENIMPLQLLAEMTDAFPVEAEMPDDGSIRLLSVGRYTRAKNFDNVPDICRRLHAKGVNVKWYLIGFGGDEGLIRRKITEAGMEEHVVILGKKDNPYPYIKACDLYVQPSRYEGKCVAVREAQMLHKPVVITNYATSGSQLTDGCDGVIVRMDNESCAEGIASVIRDAALRNRLIANTEQSDYSNAGEIEKLYELTER